MAALYRFLSAYEGLIYILLLLAALFAGRRVWNAWRELQAAIFGLEKELARQRLTFSLIGLLTIFFLFVGVLVLVSFVFPSLPAAAIVPTPTVNPLAQPGGTALPAETGQAAAASALSNGCIPGRLELTFPRSGQEISGTVELKGSADIPNFGFYKYEIAAAGSDIWATISAGREPVRDAALGLWNTSQLTPGDYQLRLVVTDNQGLALPACVVIVRVKGP